MTDFDDPYGDEDLMPVAPPKGAKGKATLAGIMPGEPDAEGDLDHVLAFQPLNDAGNAQRLILRIGDDLMYVENIGWFVWDGARWCHERGMAEAIKRGQQIALDVRKEAKALEARPGRLKDAALQERLMNLYRWSVQTGNIARVRGMLESAAPHMTHVIDELDADPLLLAAPNGTIRLGVHCELEHADRADRLTRCLGVPFKTNTACPQFERFLCRIMPDDDLRAFLQRILGYCLTGSTREHKLFIFYGTGRNGKSTLINVMRKVMGDYAMSSPVTTFLAKREGNSGSEASPDLARLPGARMVTAAEPPEGARLDESKVKEMTGGDPMTVRHLNQGFFEFRPVFKAIIATNHRPTIRGTDHGIWSRINLVPFTVQIPDGEIDRELEAKLIGEAEGILQWMLTGAEEWFAGGLRPPDKAIAAVEAYRADEDPVGEFLKAKCEICPETINPSTGKPFEVSAKRLRDSYKAWCEEEGLDALPPRTFGSKISGRGITWRKSDGHRLWVGIHLNSDPV